MAHRWYSYGPDVTARIEANCVLPSGEHIGRPFRLMPWQKDWINELYACDAKGNLRYRWSLLGIPKKNGKSTMIAALALYHLMADPDEADPWAVCAAASDRQADLVFNAAKPVALRAGRPGQRRARGQPRVHAPHRKRCCPGGVQRRLAALQGPEPEDGRRGRGRHGSAHRCPGARAGAGRGAADSAAGLVAISRGGTLDR